jgi:hypothetical protein
MYGLPDPRAVVGLIMFATIALVLLLDNSREIAGNIFKSSKEPPCVMRYAGERGIWIDRAKDNPDLNFCK